MREKWVGFNGYLNTIRELFSFFWKEKLFWMIPLVAILLLFGVLSLFAHSSPIAPLIYATF
jgi:hypothetical protein